MSHPEDDSPDIMKRSIRPGAADAVEGGQEAAGTKQLRGGSGRRQRQGEPESVEGGRCR